MNTSQRSTLQIREAVSSSTAFLRGPCCAQYGGAGAHTASARAWMVLSPPPPRRSSSIRHHHPLPLLRVPASLHRFLVRESFLHDTPRHCVRL